jgi:SAM-dependent methyltransferase
MYETFSSSYDRFVDWDARLAAELPFIARQLQAVGARRVLDAACGTGMHALALAQRGYRVVGADFSAGMIERARANAARLEVEARFEVAGFGALDAHFEGDFDALLCLGNSLPHVLTPEALAATLTDFAALLRPGGLLLIQNRNFDAVLATRDRWMGPQAYRGPDVEELFVRFYDFDPDGLLTFNVVTLRRPAGGTDWEQQITATRLWPLRRGELMAALPEAGFEALECRGDMTGAPFDVARSPNLVVTARRAL